MKEKMSQYGAPRDTRHGRQGPGDVTVVAVTCRWHADDRQRWFPVVLASFGLRTELMSSMCIMSLHIRLESPFPESAEPSQETSALAGGTRPSAVIDLGPDFCGPFFRKGHHSAVIGLFTGHGMT